MTTPVLYFDLGDTLVFGPTNNKQPFADAVSTIETLWLRGYRIGLLSNQNAGTTLEDIRQKLTDYGLEQFRFDVITISSEFSPPIFKPDPQIFQAALEKAGFTTASAQTVFITETLTHIQAARELGWRAIHKPFNAACTAGSGECINTLDDLLDMFPPLPIDVYLRDNTGDSGDEPSSGAFWNSPDLWIRNQNDNGTEHQNPRAGQDNWFCARVHNRGQGIARGALVWHKVQPWAGTQFVYSSDYYPATALVGAFVDPGSSSVTKVIWPSSEVPPEGTHACWTCAVIATGDPIPTPAYVWDSNNLAQKNLTIVEMAPGESAFISVVIGSRSMMLAQAVTLEFWQPTRGTRVAAKLGAEVPQLLVSAIARASKIKSDLTPEIPARTSVGLRFLDPARIELLGLTQDSREAAILDLAAGSSLNFGPEEKAPNAPKLTGRAPAPLTARLSEDAKGMATIRFSDQPASAIAIGLREGEILRTKLDLQLPKDAKPGERITVDLLQRAADGTIHGGVSVEIRVAKAKKSTKKLTEQLIKTKRKSS